MGVYSQECYIY